MATDIDFTQDGQETPVSEVMQKTTLTYYTIMSEWGCAWKNWGFWFSAQITRGHTEIPLWVQNETAPGLDAGELINLTLQLFCFQDAGCYPYVAQHPYPQPQQRVPSQPAVLSTSVHWDVETCPGAYHSPNGSGKQPSHKLQHIASPHAR